MAADQGALFATDETLTVGEVTSRLTRVVTAAFPDEVWVRGELDGLRPANANGHVYLSLKEKARGRDTSTLQAVVFRQSRVRIDRVLADHPGFRLADGIEVRVKGRIQYGYGRIQLVVSEIDPVHTLGRLAAERDRVLAALAGEGLLDRNRRRPLPTAPLHVALVTSDGSAACHDVLHELEASGMGFAVRVAHAKVQGNGAEASVLAALAHALARRPDVVLLVRGGGSRTDLATFDAERIARAIAAAPVPVLTGLGHEIDTSVADAVAHTAYKTPTACAAAVIDRVRAAAAKGEAAWVAVEARASTTLTDADRAIAGAVGVLAGRAGTALVGATTTLDARGARAEHLVAAGLGAAGGRLREGANRLTRATAIVLSGADDRLARASQRVDLDRLQGRLARHGSALDTAAVRIERSASAAATARSAALDVAEARASAVDPARALARGWSITTTSDGTLVRRRADAVAGTELRTTVADGTIESTVHPPAPHRDPTTVARPEPLPDASTEAHAAETRLTGRVATHGAREPEEAP